MFCRLYTHLQRELIIEDMKNSKHKTYFYKKVTLIKAWRLLEDNEYQEVGETTLQ